MLQPSLRQTPEPRQLCQVTSFGTCVCGAVRVSLIRDRAHVRAPSALRLRQFESIPTPTLHYGGVWSLPVVFFSTLRFSKSALLPSRRPSFTLQHGGACTLLTLHYGGEGLPGYGLGRLGVALGLVERLELAVTLNSDRRVRSLSRSVLSAHAHSKAWSEISDCQE